MTRTALAFCYLAEMICADEVIGNQLTSGDAAQSRHNRSAAGYLLPREERTSRICC
jgi:hypothetical protein